MSELEQLLKDIQSSEAASAAKLQWKPAHQGVIDIRIAADGNWFHQGRQFQRGSLVKLFASVLRRENDDYYLVTPAEKLRITVDDAPFIAGLVETLDADDGPAIVLTTNLGERIVVDREHPIRIEIDADSGEPRPYLGLHNGLEALITRSAFFELANLAELREDNDEKRLVLCSMGEEFTLGKYDE